MHTSILEPDAAYYRLQYSREAAQRRLVAQAQAVPHTGIAMRPRRRLARVLVSVGARLRGVTPSSPEPTPLVDPVTTGQTGP